MERADSTYVFVSRDLERFLVDNDLSFPELLKRAGLTSSLESGPNPSEDAKGTKEPVTIILASAAVVAAATPILRELIRTLSGRETAIRERRLVPVEDSAGEVLRDETGEPTLYWKNVAANSAESSQNIKIKGFGIEISFGG